jgi:uncharacterized membrane protein
MTKLQIGVRKPSKIVFAIMAAVFILGGFSVSKAHAAATSTVLGVTQVSAVQTYAVADNNFSDGWKWVFNVLNNKDDH